MIRKLVFVFKNYFCVTMVLADTVNSYTIIADLASVLLESQSAKDTFLSDFNMDPLVATSFGGSKKSA